MIAEGPLSNSPRNTKQISRGYSEGVTLLSVEEQVNTFSMVVDEKEKIAPASEESTFPKEEEAEQGKMERRHDGLQIIKEPSRVMSETKESKRNDCMPEIMSKVEEGKLEKENKCLENNEKRRNLLEFKEKFGSTKRKLALCHSKAKFSLKLSLH
ncbi:hypothetical protein M9H77_23410 [Catharanthus roseus]|uniref:Uncharacterized protein n=1 Tax=Catharanthus roseus TaxID=4058 RepID=A0ACC0AUG8_CATRO|nr:hypothetical protein M9H77_23410 [Catharanthus roseus]